MLFCVVLLSAVLLTGSALPTQDRHIDTDKAVCDDGWNSIGNECWYAVMTPATWIDAAANCHLQGAKLPTILSAEYQTKIDHEAANVDIWIGLNQIAEHGKWVWVQDGKKTLTLEETGYSNWAADEPDMGAAEKMCVHDHQNESGVRKWSNCNCDKKLKYFCVKPLSVCDDGWNSIGNECWYAVLTPETWIDAAANCHLVGAELPTILSAEYQTEIDHEAANVDIWIGLNQIAEHGKWVWVQDGKKALTLEETGYSNWAANEPDKEAANKMCAHDHQNESGVRKWSNCNCDKKLNYFCVKHL